SKAVTQIATASFHQHLKGVVFRRRGRFDEVNIPEPPVGEELAQIDALVCRLLLRGKKINRPPKGQMRAGVSDVAYVKHTLERKLVLDAEAITLDAGDRVIHRQGARVYRSPSGVRNTTARIVGKTIRDCLGLNQRRFGPKLTTRVGNTSNAE